MNTQKNGITIICSKQIKVDLESKLESSVQALKSASIKENGKGLEADIDFVNRDEFEDCMQELKSIKQAYPDAEIQLRWSFEDKYEEWITHVFTATAAANNTDFVIDQFTEEDEDYEDEDDDEIDCDGAEAAVIKAMPLKKFREIFKIEKDLPEKELYVGIVGETIIDCWKDYYSIKRKKNFEEIISDYFETEYSISDEDFQAGIDKMENLGVKDLR